MNATANKGNAFFKIVRDPIKFRLFLLRKLPAAFFSGLKVKQVSAEACIVAVPFKWFTQNPFRSTYFACLSMAAEMSTGILAMSAIYNRPQRISMLIVKSEASYHKKAKTITYFSCQDGQKVLDAVEQSIKTKESVSVTCHSEGRDANGVIIATFSFTWSFYMANK